MKKLVCIFALICILFTGCSATPSEQQQGDTVTVDISVYAEHEDRYIIEKTELEVSSGGTVFDALKQVTRDNKIHMEFSGSGDDSYVEGIDNIYMFDAGENSGWLFYINGESPQYGAAKLEVSDGDFIEWIFVKDWTKKE